MEYHETYMKRCLELAEAGMRAAMPNPSVGAVLVHNGRIIGEGHTSAYGGPHGEVNCLNSVKDTDRHLIPESTLYVSLEPCSHHGKTPPCCDLIIAHHIKNIVVGTVDTFSKVAGNGIKKLQEAGKNLTVGILQDECRHSNRRFFTYHENQRPYIILKWAESADGFLSPSSRLLDHSIIGSLDSPNDGLLNDSVNGFDQSKNQKIEPANHPIIEQSRNRTIYNKAPVWITNPYSRQLVHKWRSEEAAILVGTQTVLDDNPQLDVRTWTGTNPVRVVLDRTGRIDDYHYVKNQKIKTIVLTENNNLTNLDNLLYEVVAFNQNLPQAICSVLHRHGLLSVIIEGGRQTLQTFIDASLYDEARVFKGPVVFGNGTPAPQFTGLLTNKETILDDELLIFRKYD